MRVTARKKELRELVENSQKQLDYTQKQLQAAEEASKAARKELEATTLELQRTAPFEKEVKEKSLQLGKIRHEAVILNSHLKKALKMLKKGSPEDNVDRYERYLLSRNRLIIKKTNRHQLFSPISCS